MQLEPVNLVQISIASPAAFAAVGLAGRPHLRALAAFLFIFAVHMTLNVLEETGALPETVLVTPVLSLLYGPMIYLFIHGLIFEKAPLVWRDAVHVAPAVFALFLTDWLLIIRAATIASLAGYAAVVIWDIWRYHRATVNYRSDAEALRLNWVIAFFAGFGILTIIDIVRMLTREFQSVEFQQAAYAAMLSAVAGLLSAFVYFAVNRPSYFNGLADKDFQSANTAAESVEGPSAGDNDAFCKIEAIISRERLFCQPHLTLFDLANQSRFSERDLSRVINRVAGRSFCDYINALRVEETARLLAAEEKTEVTILDIAFEAGFTSKSTFNAAFKKEKGVTPSEYRKNGSNSSE